MKNFDIGSLDVKTLTLLCRIHEAGSLSLAAERTGIAQSTASHALDRLRKALGDPLFHRSLGGLAPTARCDDIVTQLRPLLDAMRDLGPDAEDIARDTASVTLAGNFYERCLILPALMRILQAEAPLLRLSFIPANFAPQRLLLEHQCDVAISPVASGSEKLRGELLFEESYACFVDPQSRIAREGLDLEGFARARHVGIVYAEGWSPFWRADLAHRGIDFEPVLRLPSYGGVERIIQGTDLVLTAPARLAELFCPAITKVPAPFDAVLRVQMLWSPRTDGSARHRWLRGAIRRACATLPPP